MKNCNSFWVSEFANFYCNMSIFCEIVLYLIFILFKLCRHMIRKKSKEAFIAFREALKFKFCLSASMALSLSITSTLSLSLAHTIAAVWAGICTNCHLSLWQTKQLALVGELQPSCFRCRQLKPGKMLSLICLTRRLVLVCGLCIFVVDRNDIFVRENNHSLFLDIVSYLNGLHSLIYIARVVATVTVDCHYTRNSQALI